MGRLQSLKEFVFGKKESRTASIISSPDSSGKIAPQRGYDQFAKETYLKNVTAFAAILEIATNVSSVPWKEYRRTKDDKREVVTDSAISELLRRPNPKESLEFVMLSTTAYLAMAGNTFFEKLGPDTGPNKGDPKELYALRPDRFEFKINPKKGFLEKFIYKVNGREIEWDVDPITGKSDILHLKTFHPLDDWWGAAPTEATAREIDTSNAASAWNMNLLENSGRPGMIYTLVGAVGEEFAEELDQYLRVEKAGVQNVGKNMIITGERGTKAEPYGLSPAEMDWSEGDLRIMRKIAMGYRVPPMILGIPGEATFANYKEARLAFWESTIFYYLNYIKGELNNWLYDRENNDGYFIDYVLDDVPALAIKRDSLWERATKATFLSVDEQREMVGMDKYEPDDSPGSQIYVEASKIPLGTEIVTETEGETEEDLKKYMRRQGYTEIEINQFLGLN